MRGCRDVETETLGALFLAVSSEEVLTNSLNNFMEKLLLSHFLSLGASHQIAALNLCLVSSVPLNSRIISFFFSPRCAALSLFSSSTISFLLLLPLPLLFFFFFNLPLTFSAQRLHTQTARTL